MSRSDDLAVLLSPPPAGPGVTFRQGVIVAWNPTNAENLVLVGKTTLANLPILNTSEAAILAAGDVVGILVSGSTWGILGRFTIPGSPEAVSALSSLRTASASVAAIETTSSTSFVDLTTVGPEVEISIGASGRALVTVGGNMRFEASRGSAVNQAGAYISFAMSGANTAVATTLRALHGSIRYDTLQAGGFDTALAGQVDAAKTVLVTGLVAGSTTFTAKYRADTSGTAQFDNRIITVAAL